MIEATVSLPYLKRLQAQLAVNLASIPRMLWLAIFPACGVLLVAFMGPTPDWLTYMLAYYCFLFVPFELLYRAYRGTVQARKNGPFVYNFGPDGFELQTRTANLKLSWAGVPRIHTKLGFLLVYPNKKCAYTVPLESFSPGQVETIVSWASDGGVEKART